MAISLRSAPERAVQSIGAALKALSAMPAQPFALPAEEPGEVLHHPHTIYHLGLEDLVSGKGLGAAKPVRWAYLVGAGGTASAIAEVTYDRQELSQLNQGPYAAGILNTLARAETTHKIKGGDYEFNVLRIPGIYVVALWLKDMAGAADLLVPVAPAPQRLEADRIYSEEEFTGIVRMLAGRALPSNPRPLR